MQYIISLIFIKYHCVEAKSYGNTMFKRKDTQNRTES